MKDSPTRRGGSVQLGKVVPDPSGAASEGPSCVLVPVALCIWTRRCDVWLWDAQRGEGADGFHPPWESPFRDKTKNSVSRKQQQVIALGHKHVVVNAVTSFLLCVL